MERETPGDTQLQTSLQPTSKSCDGKDITTTIDDIAGNWDGKKGTFEIDFKISVKSAPNCGCAKLEETGCMKFMVKVASPRS